MAEQTYVGPRDPNDDRANDIHPNQTSGGAFIAIAIASIALILGFIGIWLGNSADSHADVVEEKVGELGKTQLAYAKQVGDMFDTVAVKLARQATEIDLLEVAVTKLNSKAEQSMVDKLAKEIRDGKANKWEVEELASQILNKADKATVRRLARRVGKFDTRLKKVEELVLPAPEAPVPAPADKPVPPLAAKEAPKVPSAAPASVPQPLGAGPGGRPEVPVKPVNIPPAK